MRKNTITLLVAFMSVALLGIILLQINWIRHDFLLREQRFDQQVNDALHSVVDKIETRQAFHFISTRFFNLQNDSVFWHVIDSSVVHTGSEPLELRLDSTPGKAEALLARGRARDDGPRVEPRMPGGQHVTLLDTVRAGNKTRKERIDINTDSDRTTTRIDRMRVDEEVLRSDVMEMRNDLMEAEVEKERIRMEQELIKLKVKLNTKVGKLNEVMNRVALAYITGGGDIDRSVPPALVDSLLQKELRSRGINTEYAYGIIDTRTDSVLAAGDTTRLAALMDSPYSVDLYPNELVSKGQVLNLHFPARTTFVLSSLSWMLGGSALFTLTIIFVFFYTVQMLMRQKELSDIKSDFINNMTHEFKTPIATIALAMDAINNPHIAGDRDKVNYYSNIVREENKRMNQQVETILQTALFEKKDFRLHKRPVDLHALVRKAAGNIRVQVESRGGTVRLDLAAGRCVVQGDEILLTTAIVNLLDNANKYSPGAPDITVSTANREKSVLLSVQDRGMGMDRETLTRIFEKFYRKSTGNLHDIKGFGLGLSNVKSIVAAHGGEIHATSEPGAGSRFEILLPLVGETDAPSPQ